MDDDLRAGLDQFYQQAQDRSRIAPDDLRRLGGDWVKPIESLALEVTPRMIPAQMAEDAKRGVSVEYNAQGQPVFRNRVQYGRYLKAYGYYLKSSYNGRAG